MSLGFVDSAWDCGTAVASTQQPSILRTRLNSLRSGGLKSSNVICGLDYGLEEE